MSGVCAPHLQCRNGIFHLRLRVPDAIRPLLGRSEVRRSLMTSSHRQARLRVGRYAARVMEIFEVIAQTTLSPDQARALVQQCFHDLVVAAERTGGFVPATRQPDLEIAEQIALSRERVFQLRSQVDVSSFDHSIQRALKLIAQSKGMDDAALDPSSRLNVSEGIARALIEEQRLFQLRATDRLKSFEPIDPLFCMKHDEAPVQPCTSCEAPTVKGPTVEDAIARYLQAGRAKWVRKTYEARVWQLGFFRDHVSGSMPLEGIAAEHIRTFRDAVRTLHRSHGRRVGKSFIERQTENAAYRISDKTASITFEPVKAFFRWCVSEEGLLDRNPAENVRLALNKTIKGRKGRRPFSADELSTLFNAPMFKGCKSRHRRYEPGASIIRDAKYWLPILGLYTGARLGELVQLHVADVHIEGPIPYLSINEDNTFDTAGGNRKHVKSEAGVRRVPLHPDPISLGFADFVQEKAKPKSKSCVRLFAEFPYGSDGQASTVASKFFARFMDSVGLTDPGLVFHSFRHNAEDALRDALVPKYVIDRIIGHADQSAGALYGEGVALDVAADAVAAMRLKFRLAG